jgi:type IV secretion system protein VirB5
VVRASDDSFQVKWIEQTFERGSLSDTSRYTALLSIVLQSPATEDQLRKNPLGIYVNGLDWSRELA